MICHTQYIFVWIFFISRPTDGGSVTWYEPFPTTNTSNSTAELFPGIVQAYEGSSAKLNWIYSLSSKLLVGIIEFGTEIIYFINMDGSARSANTKFQERFNVSSTLGRVSLFISPVSTTDDRRLGEFTCKLSDSMGTTWKRAIHLQVLVPTNITGIRGNQTILEGDNLQLTCEATGQPEPNITWTKGKPGNQGNTVVVQEGKVLTITNINRTDAGIFTCTAYNGFGRTESQAVYVNVTYPAKIVNFEHQYVVGVGQSQRINCEAKGNPPPTHGWTPCNDSEQVCDKETLHISQVCEDANYTCKVANGAGSDTKTANVFIEAEWIFITINMTDGSCTEGKHSKSLLSNGFKITFQTVFKNLKRMEVIDNRCSTVKLALKFNSITKQTDVVKSLRDAAQDGYLGKFPVCPTCINGATSCDVTPGRLPTHPALSNYLKKDIIIIMAVSLFVLFLVVIIVGNLFCWCFRTNICIVFVIQHIRKSLCKKNKDSKVHSNGGQDAGMGTYNLSFELPEKRGNGEGASKKPLPEYAVV